MKAGGANRDKDCTRVTAMGQYTIAGFREGKFFNCLKKYNFFKWVTVAFFG